MLQAGSFIGRAPSMKACFVETSFAGHNPASADVVPGIRKGCPFSGVKCGPVHSTGVTVRPGLRTLDKRCP